MKLKRYHTDIFCPEWTRSSILKFISNLSEVELQYSYHASIKVKKMGRKYKAVVKSLISNIDLSDELYLDYVFEFYANNSDVIKKVCYRFPIRELDSDIVLVISSTGKIITIYLNDNFDKHRSLNKDLYEKGDKIESKVTIND